MTKILEALNWHGEAGMEWKYDEKTDDYYFLEMNPRFEGSLDIAIKSGVNLPRLLIEIMNGKEVSDNIHYKENVHYRLFFRQDFQCFLKNQTNPVNYFFECFNPKINGELTFDDLSVIKFFWKKPFFDIINHIKNGNN